MDLSATAKELVFLGSIALIVLVTLWDYYSRRRRSRLDEPVADARESEPYKVYTRDYDLVLPAEEVPRRLPDASDDAFNGKSDQGGKGWRQRVESAKRWMAEHPQAMDMAPRFAAALRAGGIADPADVAITLLIDQSASMRGDPMSAAYAAIAGVEAALSRVGVRIEILGFSTAGWRGGFARKMWVADGRPKRPGRLCALLHIIYKAHGQPEWTRASREAMLHPDILRENIDGEALEWAAGRLRGVAAGTKVLLVISDGAAVDDTTIMHNGKAYLERHLLKTIAAIEAEGAVRLGALGVRHDVSRYYRNSRNAGLESLPEDLLALAMDVVAGTPARHETEAA